MISKAKQERIIAAITDGHSLVKACRDAKVSRATLYRYMGKDKDPQYMPSYKVVHSLGRLYKKRGKVDRAALEEMRDLVWKNCVLCGRCYCAFGIDLPYMIAFTRSILRSQGIYGVFPHTSGSPEAECAEAVDENV